METTLTCKNCQKTFIVNLTHLFSISGVRNLPIRCQTCSDKRTNNNPSDTTTKREVLFQFSPCKIEIDQKYFQPFQSTQHASRPCKRAILRGSIGQGASWQGRIDMYDFRVSPADPGCVRIMEVTKECGKSRMENHGEVMGAKKEVSVQYSPTWQYISIDPIDGDPTEELETLLLSIWRTDYKTTLKGFGRQYHSSWDTSRMLWSYSMGSSARSGRFGSSIIVGIIGKENPIIEIFSEDGHKIQTAIFSDRKEEI